jgi:hypothetical protein
MICTPPAHVHWLALQALVQYVMGFIDGDKFIWVASMTNSDSIAWAECIVKALGGTATGG